MISPKIVSHDSFQLCWLEASRYIQDNGWSTWNLVVHIIDPKIFDETFNDKIDLFCNKHSILKPKDVCYTIFPYGLNSDYPNGRKEFYDAYLNKFFPRTQKRIRQKKGNSGWGTYFQRMVSYGGGKINQLENIITAINDRIILRQGAYTILIEIPGSETIRPMGAPCLNYIAIQLENNPNKKLSLLAIYRNHDFLRRAYGNYWGLCQLQMFLCRETGLTPGPLTCISSHAYVDNKRTHFKNLLSRL